jgi:poly(A) polymerase
MTARPGRQVADEIAAVLRRHGHVALLAGGCVRDLLLGRTPKDYDVVTDATPDQVVALFRRTEKVGAQFGVVIVRLHGRMIEVATFRSDGDYHDGRHPDSIRFASAEEDARRRDFTINGMFLDPTDGRVIDFVGGQADLGARLIRAIGDPAQRFAEDHLRMLRAVRFAAALGFEITPDTQEAIRCHAPRIRDISIERIQQELERILANVHRRRGWELLAVCGLLEHVFPEAAWTAPDVRDAAERLAPLPADADFMVALAVVLRRFTPPEAAQTCRRLRCSNEIERGVAWLLEKLPRGLAAGALELADVKLLLADARCARLTLLVEAECRGRLHDPRPLDVWRARVAAIPPEAVAPPPFIGGDDLRALGIPEGPIYKQVLEAAYRAQLNEQVPDRAAALRLAQTLLADAGFARP